MSNGDFVKGYRTGKGKFTWKNGDFFEGDFLNDNKKKGKLYYKSSNIFISGYYSNSGEFIKN